MMYVGRDTALICQSTEALGGWQPGQAQLRRMIRTIWLVLRSQRDGLVFYNIIDGHQHGYIVLGFGLDMMSHLTMEQ